MYKLIVYFLSLEIAGFLSFIIFSRLLEDTAIRYIPFLFSFLAACYLASLKTKLLSFKSLFNISLSTTFLFIIFLQLAGYASFPGLAKDIDFSSIKNALRTCIMLFIGTIGNFLLLVFARKL